MNSAHYVGRIGALAVALGIGTAVASGAVVQAAPDTGQPNPTVNDDASTDGPPSPGRTIGVHHPKPLRSLIRSITKPDPKDSAAPKDTTEPRSTTEPKGTTEPSGTNEPEATVDEAVAVQSVDEPPSTQELAAARDVDTRGIARLSPRLHRPLHTVIAATKDTVGTVTTVPGAVEKPSQSQTPAVTTGPTLQVQTPSAAKTITTVQAAAAVPVPVTTPSPIRRVLSFLTTIGLTPEAFPAGSPLAPLGRILEFAFTALRRVDNVLYNQPPTGFSTSAPAVDPKSGVATGTLAIDPDGDQLNYTVTQAPTYGTLDVAQTTPGTLTYTYTPDYTKTFTGNEVDSFTVDVTDDTTYHVNPGEAVVTVSNIDVLPNNFVVKTIDPGGDPTGIAVNKAGTRVYVTDDLDATLKVIDSDPTSGTYNTVIQTVSVGGGPESVTSVTRADGREFVYVASTQENFSGPVTTSDDVITVYENVGGTLVSRPTIDLSPDGGPMGSSSSGLHDIKTSPDGSTIYVTTFDDLVVVDTATNSVTAKVPLNYINSELAVANTANGLYGYVVNFQGEIQVINLSTNMVETNITDPHDAGDDFLVDVVTSPDGRYAYVAGEGIYKIDTTTNTIVATFPSSIVPGDPTPTIHDPRGIAISPDGTRLYVTEINFNDVLVVDTTTGEVIGVTTVADTFDVVATPDGTRAYAYAFDPTVFGGNPQVSVIAYEVPPVEV